jgi:predicted phosphodiesterase
MGQRSAGRGWDQEMVLDALARDTAKLHRDGLVPTPRALFVTGDIAFGGKPEQHEKADIWLERVVASVGLRRSHIYAVPGNHDVDRDADKDRPTKRLLGLLRDGAEDIDEALQDARDRTLLENRMASYLAFTKGLGSPADLHWSVTRDFGRLTLTVLGLNTALLAADSGDLGKLRLGKEQLARLTDTTEDQLTLVLTHHPFAEGWLRDEKAARDWIEQRADIHLCGHTHDAEAAARRTAGGTGIVTVVAGASHGDTHPAGVPETHGYNWAGVFRDANGTLVLRVWPRVWNKRKDFRLDVSQVPDGKLFAEHALPRVRLPAR